MEDPKIKKIDLATMGNDICMVTIGLGLSSDPSDQDPKDKSPGKPPEHQGQ